MKQNNFEDFHRGDPQDMIVNVFQDLSKIISFQLRASGRPLQLLVMLAL